MSRPRFLSALLEVYENATTDEDDNMIILVHWCFIHKHFYVMDQNKKVKQF